MPSPVLAVQWWFPLQRSLEERERVVNVPQCGTADRSGQMHVAKELFLEVREGACAVNSTNVQSRIQEELKILLLRC